MNDATNAHVDEEHPVIRDDPPQTTKTIMLNQQNVTRIRGVLVPTAVPVREICSECGRVSPVGFHVPDHVWNAVMPKERWQDILCIMCFARFADRLYVEWAADIEFFPVSKKMHREESMPRKQVFKENRPH